MSINSSLVKLADKIDSENKSDITPDYINPNNSIEKSLERIADNYSSSGGSTGGGVFAVNGVVNIGEGQMSLDKTCGEIKAAYKQGSIVTFNTVYEEGSDYGATVGYLATIDSGSDYFQINFIVNMGGAISLLYFEASGENDYAVHQL